MLTSEKLMPSIRNNPPPRDVPVKILRGCCAAGEKHAAGSVVNLSALDARRLVSNRLAEYANAADVPEKGAMTAKPKAKKKVARGRPAKNAER